MASDIATDSRTPYIGGKILLLRNSDDDGERQLDHLSVLAERRIDGLVPVAAGDGRRTRDGR